MVRARRLLRAAGLPVALLAFGVRAGRRGLVELDQDPHAAGRDRARASQTRA